jgi:hypothetical protein
VKPFSPTIWRVLSHGHHRHLKGNAAPGLPRNVVHHGRLLLAPCGGRLTPVGITCCPSQTRFLGPNDMREARSVGPTR